MPTDLPHSDVHARIGPSRIHGIGVIAIRSIPSGTELFGNDGVDLVWVDSEALDRAALTPAERAFYEDFGIRRGDRIGCPVNFNNLTPGWYLNQPPPGQSPNVRSDRDFVFTAARDIAEGEELTILYSDFNDPEP
jgi:hypothetical protein